MGYKCNISLTVIALLLHCSFIVFGQDSNADTLPTLGSADQVDNRITFDGLVKQPVFELDFLQPYFDFKEERLQLDDWAQSKGEEGIKEYWKEKNEVSIDGIPTKIQEGY